MHHRPARSHHGQHFLESVAGERKIMFKFSRMWFGVLVLVLVGGLAHAGTFPGLTTPVLETRFADEPLGPIGLGGPELGQPVVLLNDLTAEVIEDGLGGRTLELDRDGGTNNQLAVFEFIGHPEYTSGLVYIDFELTLPRLDNYLVQIVRQGTLAGNFQNLRLSHLGDITIFAGGDSTNTSIGSYSAGDTLTFRFIYDMDERTYDVYLNDVIAASDRPFSVFHSIGIGRVAVGYQSTGNGGGFELGWLKVSRDVELDPVLNADFADKSLGQPLATGGAEVGEPVAMSSVLTTEVVEISPDNRGVYVERASGTIVADLRWKFLKEIELDDGQMLADVSIAAEHFTDYRLTLRGGTSVFYQIVFDSDGEIRRTFPGDLLLGTYSVGTMIRVRMLCDMVERHCSTALDDAVVDSERAMLGETPAIDNLITGKMGSTAPGTGFTLERVAVYSSQVFDTPADRYFVQQPSNALQGTAIVPAVSVRVDDQLGGAIAEPVEVTLELEGGDDAAVLANATAMTNDGVAVFSNLNIDRPGDGYRLRAQAADLPDTEQSLSDPFDIQAPEDSIFSDRWQATEAD
jgi:hypothetical protein